jgi:hypothetical protein
MANLLVKLAVVAFYEHLKTRCWPTTTKKTSQAVWAADLPLLDKAQGKGHDRLGVNKC